MAEILHVDSGNVVPEIDNTIVIYTLSDETGGVNYGLKHGKDNKQTVVRCKERETQFWIDKLVTDRIVKVFVVRP